MGQSSQDMLYYCPLKPPPPNNKNNKQINKQNNAWADQDFRTTIVKRLITGENGKIYYQMI